MHHYLGFALGVISSKGKDIFILKDLEDIPSKGKDIYTNIQATPIAFMSPPLPTWSSSVYISHLESRLEF